MDTGVEKVLESRGKVSGAMGKKTDAKQAEKFFTNGF